ncbi:Uncharacterized protein TPAR_06234 [Tolypocladium paradoxum]|uniref:DJ-1/PfpI domain-containing protein n=1 Tax=Tolypocladium paradoxum TaxID=94208 RepID=A0A2S4KTP1_9HYPO|nr:Uncharacterized protein TPAR_06234 [Tolypocladium paradoxum]
MPSELPRNWAVALFNSFDPIDIFGPIDPLFYLSFSRQLNLALVSDTLDPVWVRTASEALNKMNSTFQVSVNPTHTYNKPPKDIDVLLVPGGPGSRLGNVTTTIDFVRKVYPNLKYLITTCTGAGIAARAGVLDGKRATTNKAAWNTITPMGPNVKWTSPARWVVDGNIWTSSGIASGLDLIFAFIEAVYGEKLSHDIQGITEHQRTTDPCDDPFAGWYHVPASGHCNMS